MPSRREFLQGLGILGAAAATELTVGRHFKVEAQENSTTYDLAWLRSVAIQNDAIDQINIAWDATENWRAGQTSAGTYDIPAHSVVIGSMNAGNHPSFENLAQNIWYTAAGGRFGTEEGYRTFQLEDAIEQPTNQPDSVSAMETIVLAEEDYGEKIALLDMEFSNNPNVINRWGTSGVLELLTNEQLTALKEAGLDLQPVVQVLPGNVIVWGELAPGELHTGLRRIDENIYATTGEGGTFVTLRGFRAIQFAQ